DFQQVLLHACAGEDAHYRHLNHRVNRYLKMYPASSEIRPKAFLPAGHTCVAPSLNIKLRSTTSPSTRTPPEPSRSRATAAFLTKPARFNTEAIGISSGERSLISGMSSGSSPSFILLPTERCAVAAASSP